MRRPVVYAGQRVTNMGKIVQTFKDAKGNYHEFIGVKGVFPGACYYMNGNTIKTKPKRIATQMVPWTENDELKFEGNKLAVKHQRELNKRIMDLRKPHPDITKAVLLLRPFARSMGVTELHRFMGYVINEVSKKGKK